MPVGELDRERAVGEVLARLAARRSAWNAADIRGEVEQLIARRNIVTDAAVRGELAEDLTARALGRCVPLLDRVGVPEHIRALTSRHVLDVEADLAGRLAARADAPSRRLAPARRIDDASSAWTRRSASVVAALASDRQLVVVEGAAGAGKTTTLAAARAALEQRGGRLRGGHADAEGRAGRRPAGRRATPRRRRGWPTSTASGGTTTAPGPACTGRRSTR